MKQLSKKDLLFVGLMLFSLFFGAGNLIFPPFLGQSAGDKVWIALGAFLITAVGFPVLGVIAVAKSGGLSNLATRVHPVFAPIFTVLIYLSIGPCLGIPRAGSLPFEMVVAPYLPEGMSDVVARLLFTLVFFLVAYWLSLSPTKLVDRMGKVLTPVLLVLIFVVIIGSFFKPLGTYGQATGAYMESPFVTGFLEGYLTMDTIAALNFGIVIALAIRAKGVEDEKLVVSTSIKAGLIAGGLLVIIYGALAHLGATSGGRFGVTENGAHTLTNVMTYLFGQPGAVLLAVIFTLACLTTCVGLITSCSQYFATLTHKVSYVNWVRILSLSSMILANMGLSKILAISIPVLDMIYPIAIMLIILAILDRYFKQSSVIYGLTILFTGIVSVMYGLNGFGIDLGSKLLGGLPLYTEGLGWVVPALVGMLVGGILEMIKVRKIKEIVPTELSQDMK